MNEIKEIMNQNRNGLFYYSPYNFIRDINPVLLVNETIINPTITDLENGKLQVECITIQGQNHFFIIRYLNWDSEYFGFPSFRVEYILYTHKSPDILQSAIHHFCNCKSEKNSHYFFEIPCEDLLLLQSLTGTKFKLIETRIHFYLHKFNASYKERYSIRSASLSDIDALKKVAMKMRNKYDRVHADPAFSLQQADEYMGTYIEECIKGFSDFIIVPDIPDIPASGFCVGNKPRNILGINVSKLIITAVDKDLAKGWLIKLSKELLQILKNENADYVLVNTQAPNRASIHTLLKCGFLIGFVTHIYAFKN